MAGKKKDISICISVSLSVEKVESLPVVLLGIDFLEIIKFVFKLQSHSAALISL